MEIVKNVVRVTVGLACMAIVLLYVSCGSIIGSTSNIVVDDWNVDLVAAHEGGLSSDIYCFSDNKEASKFVAYFYPNVVVIQEWAYCQVPQNLADLPGDCLLLCYSDGSVEVCMLQPNGRWTNLICR